MRNFKVEVIHAIKKYGCVTIEADNREQAIEKARNLDWNKFERSEKTEETQWEVDVGSWWDKFLSFFSGQ